MWLTGVLWPSPKIWMGMVLGSRRSPRGFQAAALADNADCQERTCRINLFADSFTNHWRMNYLGPLQREAAAKAGGKSYLPQIDGLRGLAILSVMFHHFGVHLPGWFDPGPVGVRIFFMLSGYLITLSLWRMISKSQTDGGIWHGVWGFHVRRMVRLAPILYLMIGIGFLLGLPEFREGLVWHLAFLSNFYVLAHQEWPGAASHLWSLSMQEQFYVLWPFVILVVPRRYLPATLVAFILGAVTFRAGCMMTDVSVFVRWMMLPGSIDSFALGALLACWKKSERPLPLASGIPGVALAAAALACWIVSRYFRFSTSYGPYLAFTETFENVTLGWILLMTIQGWPGGAGKFFSWRPLVYLGKISYGIYVFHVMAHVILRPWLDGVGLTMDDRLHTRAIILCIASIGAASLSYRFLELPLAAWIRERQTKPRVSNSGLNFWELMRGS